MFEHNSLLNRKKNFMSVEKLQRAIIIIFMLSFILFINACGKQNPERRIPIAKKGILDLRAWDFEKDGPVKLNGEWEIYWEKLPEGTESDLDKNIQPDGFFDIPKIWKGHTLADGRVLGHIGYATYRLKILLPPDPGSIPSLNNLAIRTEWADSAYSIKVISSDGSLLGRQIKAGVVGKSRETSIPLRRFDMAAVEYSPEWTLIYQISNFHDFYSGPYRITKIGLHKQLRSELDSQRSIDFITFGILLVIGIYHLILFGLYTIDRSSLWFGLLCLVISSYTLLNGHYIEYIYPEVYIWGFFSKALLLSILFIPVFMISFFRSLFPDYSSKIVFYALISIFLTIIAYFFLVPFHLGTNWFVFIGFYLVVFVMVLWSFYVILKALYKEKSIIAGVIVAGFGIFSGSILHDSLCDLGFIVHSIYILPYGLVLFIIFQSISIAIKNQQAHKDKHEAQQHALDTLKESDRLKNEFMENLELKVEERTHDLEIARVKAENANRAKSIFLANMSHELRTPLNAILGFTQLTTRDKKISDTAKENLSIINRSGEHLLDLINSVLDMSKIEAGMDSLAEKNFDLFRTLDSIESLMKNRSDKKGLSLHLERDNNLKRYIKTDENKLQQVLINLLGNAIKFTSSGSITLRVAHGQDDDFDTDTGRVTLNFEIEDTGPGIPEEDIENIFKAFTQSSEDKSDAGGTGLGLSISRELVRQLGGEISVVSKVGSGSIFNFHIIVSVVNADVIEEVKPDRTVIGIEEGFTAPDGTPFRVLVVEDNYESRTLLCRLLKETGFEVKEAVNGKKGVELTRDWMPHLIWMDIRMPIMDGYNAVQQIRSEVKKTDILNPVIIALTASVFEEEMKNILSKGFDDFVRKPFKIGVIFEKMAEHLRVEYIYEEADIESKLNEHEKLSDANLNAGIKALPSGIVTELLEATELSDVKMIEGVISHIRQQNSRLADLLQEYTGDYAFDKILNVLNKAIGK